MSAELPPTAVPMGIDDPVERARAELKAALSAIEEKANVPAADPPIAKAKSGIVRFQRCSNAASKATVPPNR